MRKLFLLPTRNLTLTIPFILILGFITGLTVDTSGLQKYILPVTIIMIYPTMIGFKLGEILNLAHRKLLFFSIGINFIFIPLLAYCLGTVFLQDNPQFFAGLVLASLIPTANMTIAYTMFARGNVPAAIKLTVVGLILGSLLAPWYLQLIVGRYIPVDIITTLKTITLVVFLPLILGTVTYQLLLKKYSRQEFNKKIKPYLPATSAWGAIYIVFTSISINGHSIISNSQIILTGLMVQLVFYAVSYYGIIQAGRYFFNREDSIALVYSTALRNLSIAIGLAATAFGADAALMVALAFLIQGQSAAWFLKFTDKPLRKQPPRESQRVNLKTAVSNNNKPVKKIKAALPTKEDRVGSEIGSGAPM